MAQLRDRRHAETRQAILAAALALFDRDGFGAVTMEQIAMAAGVSRRTVYRRFPTKDHIVLEVPKRWLAAWDDAVAGMPDADPLAVAETACRAVARHIDGNRADVLIAYAALEASPALRSAGATTHEWTDRIIQLLQREPVHLPASTRHVIAGAYLGAIDAMMMHWISSEGQGSVQQETTVLLDRLRPIWPPRAEH